MKKILGIVGSLRKNSLNGMLMGAIKKEAEAKGLVLEVADISSVPLFNQDLEQNFPKEVLSLKEKIKNADAIIVATPEYNRSMPGVLKNFIDWTSRPYGTTAWAGKVVATVGASGGAAGTMAAQYSLKQVLLYNNAKVMGQPEFYLGGADKKFDTDGNLTDDMTKMRIKDLLDAMAKAA
jgi:chromate reductase, NAD(P)H dehydrogenase (quinone)